MSDAKSFLGVLLLAGIPLLAKKYYASLQNTPETLETRSIEDYQDLFHDCCEVSEECECQFGFKREEFKRDDMLQRMNEHNFHIFITSGQKSTEWKPRIEEDNTFVKLLDNSLKKFRKEFKVKITAIEDKPKLGTGVDLLIFPSMMRFNGVTEEDIPLVAEFLSKGKPSPKLNTEKLTGTYVFVCCHHSRDKRCGVCGPRLFKRFYEKVESVASTISTLHENARTVIIKRTSHVGAHKFAGNVIIYRYNEKMQKYFGDWFGYVSLEDVDRLVEHYIIGGELKNVKDLWRGRCDMSNSIAQTFLKFQ